MSATTHVHQSITISTSATANDLVICINHGGYRDPADSVLSQLVRVWNTPTIITDFTNGFPVNNAANYTMSNPLKNIAFCEDVRLVSQSYTLTYIGNALTAAGSINATPIQYSLASNTTIKKSAVDLSPNLKISQSI